MIQFTSLRLTTVSLLAVALMSSLPSSAESVEPYPSLWDSFDAELQQGLEIALDDLGLRSAVDRKQLSVALVDATDLAAPRVAAVNGDDMIYAASLPKIAILLGAFVEIERGDMQLDSKTRESLTNMIRVSSNSDATKMLNEVGKPRLAEILRSERFRLYDPKVNGGLWVGKDYGKRPAWKRDPLHNLSHGATALQTARFYYMLETGQLVSDELSHEMKEMLSEPAIKHKFVKGLEDRPGAKIYRKSGSWRQWHADSAIVEHAGRKYIVAALAQSKQGGAWLSNLIRPIDDLIVETPEPRKVRTQWSNEPWGEPWRLSFGPGRRDGASR